MNDYCIFEVFTCVSPAIKHLKKLSFFKSFYKNNYHCSELYCIFVLVSSNFIIFNKII